MPDVQPQIPANIAPYVDALGVDDTIRLLLELGGSQIHLPRAGTSSRSMAAGLLGAEKIAMLAAVMGHGYIKVPLGKKWIAQVMFARGESLNAIARTVRSDVATVRRWQLNDALQLDLF
ncbi:helix-turn-helix domain containing protein [Stappia sp. F7233]|uniref:Helix-turn-helix domain containing protein n=1 Tax=Stappia albiluteola TaxID=2758565 RepID=A0A839AG39_9HYPH|nr:helix-turn-helix domain containing protein [Stappia albiluteola]MBA5777456.1 helix-turn-helix domain containing protein [Stappia albiluteola]MBA5777494.1 helix-turn-helix domain containing protein [Stappia albiluteola]MBA5778095.1 helix-turn-helix domain containing protein [Stappia albiluteola]MBA5778128.1 helix-turn-helix domain containing protein [Stappia albiluteola]